MDIKVEFTGGLEMLFDNRTVHQIHVPSTTSDGSAFTVGDLIPWLVDNALTDSRKELFVLNESIRPGILVLINDADWELEGENKYEVKNGDTVLFVSTLHGG